MSARRSTDAAGFGWTIPNATFDWPTLIANKDKEIARLEAAYTANVEKAGAQHRQDPRGARGRAHRCGSRTARRSRAKYILIATGGAPNHGAAIPGIEHVISSNEAFHLKQLPRRIVIQGGGYIALEFACIFAGFGSDVTVIYRGDNILRGFDEDVRTHVRSRDGEGRHHHPDRLHREQGRQARRATSPRICRTARASPPTR